MAITSDRVKERLSTLGYTASDDDDTALDFLISLTTENVLNFIYASEIPEELEYTVINYVAARFLAEKIRTADVTDGYVEGFNLDAAVGSLSEGDVSITYKDSADVKGAFLTYLDGLVAKLNKDLISFRRLRW